MEGTVDGRYKLRREIARGGHGLVYEADHLVTGMRVAIKLLIPSGRSNPQTAARLLREARILGAVRHTYVVAVQDAGVCPMHGPYVVLEMIEGRSLDGILLTRHRLSVGQTVAVALQLCAALGEVHRRGILHRDVKPGNVLISRTPLGDQVELIDFGIATFAATDAAADGGEPKPEKLTRDGQVLGTVEYMAPEQLMAEGPIDARADLYSVGAMLYECLTGEVPYTGTLAQIIASVMSGTRPTPIGQRRTDVPVKLENVIRRALKGDRAERFASSAELAEACSDAIGGNVPPIALLDVQDDRAQVPPKASDALPPSGDVRRRQFPRVPYVAPVRVVVRGGTSYDGHCEDISEGGLLVITDYGNPHDQAVTVHLPLPMSGRVVTLEALAKWVKTRRGQHATGVEFMAAPDEALAEIRAYAQLMGGKPQSHPRRS